MKVTEYQLKKDLSRVGIYEGDILVVHSSLRSIGLVEDGPLTLINALRSVVGDKGGVLFPCLTFSGSVTEFLRQTTSVDLRNVRISTGAVPQTAWNHSEARRSIHPTHPVVAFGKRGYELVSGVQNGQGPCGTDSSFYKAAMADAKILMIGVNCSSNTTLHCIEELYAPYIFSGEVFNVETTDYEGGYHEITVRGYCIGIKRNFQAVEPELFKKGIMNIYNIGQAETRVIDARRMFEEVSRWVQADPWFLVEKADV